MPQVKSKTIVSCSNCGAEYLRWQGQCEQCNAWNTLEKIQPPKNQTVSAEAPLVKMVDVHAPTLQRISSGFVELDRLLGGGWAEGSVTMICGEPGIGKSTLVLQSILTVGNAKRQRIMYISAEESAIQVKDRSNRLCASIPDDLYISVETDIAAIVSLIHTEKPDIVVLDSIQMVVSHDLSSMSGSINQVRMCASLFMKAIKAHGCVGIMVGHITKDGQLAGPKMLEHMVDVILFFEGERGMSVRMLRALKNRYGTTNETGVFRMLTNGLNEITDHQLIVSNRSKQPMSGAIFTAILSGTRAMIVEIQSLVVDAGYQQSKRTFVGIDSHRAHLMIAVLDKYFKLKFPSKDVFTSMVGGVKTHHPDSDLAICFSMLSSYFLTPFPKGCIVLGEVGLTGEVLPVAQLDRYIQAMNVIGAISCILPKQNASDWPKNQAVQPHFVDSIFDAYSLFNQLCTTKN